MDDENVVLPSAEELMEAIRKRVEETSKKWKEEEIRPCGCVFQKYSGMRIKSCGTSHWRPARAKAA